MRKLTRHHAPACLATLKSNNINWNKVSKENKDEIWAELNYMQDGFCAYCECRLSKRKHIEHFKKREMRPDLRFDWFNLFGSCGDTKEAGGWNNCGIYKDNRKAVGEYDIAQLIKPDEEDPDCFLLFLTTGKVFPHSNLNAQDQKKASETIRVLNLNRPSLCNRRRIAIKAIWQHVEEFWEPSKDFNEEDHTERLHDILAKIKKQEFQTALKHRFDYNKT